MISLYFTLSTVVNGCKIDNAGKTVIISNQPYFYKKAELFPGSAFVIGADTAARLISVRKFILLKVFCNYFKYMLLRSNQGDKWKTLETFIHML